MTPEATFAAVWPQVRVLSLVTEDRCRVLCMLAAEQERLGGEIWECGVYRGGTAFLLAAATAAVPIRLFDTFTGIPHADPAVDLHRVGDFGDTSVEAVRELLARHDRVVLYPGLIPDTFAAVEHGAIGLLHVDVDVYESVTAVLEYCYPRMAPWGVIVIDDYGAPSCPGATVAVERFFAAKPERVYALAHTTAVVIMSGAEAKHRGCLERHLPRVQQPAGKARGGQRELTAAERAEVEGRNWRHSIELAPGYFTKGNKPFPQGDYATERYGFPASLAGKTVLDVGTAEGFFAFEAERRGAALVVALDVNADTGLGALTPGSFLLCKEILQSKVLYVQAGIEEADRLFPGAKFDFVFLFGLLYHLRDPFLGLRNAANLCGGTMIIETADIPPDVASLPASCPGWVAVPSYAGDATNHWCCNKAGLQYALQQLGWRMETLWAEERRFSVRAVR